MEKLIINQMLHIRHCGLCVCRTVDAVIFIQDSKKIQVSGKTWIWGNFVPMHAIYMVLILYTINLDSNCIQILYSARTLRLVTGSRLRAMNHQNVVIILLQGDILFQTGEAKTRDCVRKRHLCYMSLWSLLLIHFSTDINSTDFAIATNYNGRFASQI